MPGLFPIRTVVVSSAPSAASVRGVQIRLAAPAAATPPRNPRRLGDAEVGGLEHGAQHALGRNGVVADVIAAAH